VVGNVYPVTRKYDYKASGNCCDYYDQSNGKSLRPGFDAHFVTVSVKSGFQAVPCPDKENPNQLDELVVDSDAQILPWAIVYFKKFK